MLLSQKEMYLSCTRRRTAYNLTHIIANIISTGRCDKHIRANYSIVPRYKPGEPELYSQHHYIACIHDYKVNLMCSLQDNSVQEEGIPEKTKQEEHQHQYSGQKQELL
jgi:hypothetical protein